MGNRRLGTKRLEAAMDNLFDHAALNGVNGSPFTLKNPDRYYLEEYFAQRPALNATNIIDPDANDAAALAAFVAANKNFEILGTSASDDDVTFSAAMAGIQLQVDGTDNDSVIVLPHLDTNQTAWSGVKWGTETKVQWECTIRTDASVATMGIWAGLKLTNTPVYGTDDDQAYFIYDTSDDSGALSTNGNLHFVYSVGGTDYISDLGITVAAATNYRLGITIDENRQVSAWVDGVQYSLTTLTTAGGVVKAKGTELSKALTNDVDLIPYVGVICRTGTASVLHLSSIKISRQIFES